MADPKTPIELLEPMGPCPVAGTRPTFRWRLHGTRVGRTALTRRAQQELAKTRLRLQVWTMRPRSRVSTVMRKPPVISEVISGDRLGFRFPRQLDPLDVATGYLWQVERLDARGRVIVASEPGVFYVEDLAWPFSLSQLLCCDDDPMLDEDFAAWEPAYGRPRILDKEPGCDDSLGIARLSGTATHGSAITQRLAQGRAIRAGKHYVVSFCVRRSGRLAYGRFRVYAHSGDLRGRSGHPQPSSAVTPIGETGRITTKEWSWVVLAPWCAPRDFDRIAIAAIADGDHVRGRGLAEATGEISNICIREVTGCESTIGAAGSGPEFAFGTNVAIDTDVPPTAQAVVTQLGQMQGLFGDRFADDGRDHWYGSCNECASIGGWVPDDYHQAVPWFDADEQTLPPGLVEAAIEKLLDDLGDPGIADDLEPIDFHPDDCAGFDPAPFPHDARIDYTADPPAPFSGRDIVYVHGFIADHIIARSIKNNEHLRALYGVLPDDEKPVPAELVEDVDDEWPGDPDPYLAGGYFRTAPEKTYWADHIEQYLVAPGHQNRYLVAGYNCSQRLVYAVHSILEQIARAMNTGEGVREGNSKAGTTCFGKEYVIVTHSTGALVVNVAMAIAARTAEDPELQAVYGDVSGIARRAKTHVSLHGALAGSEGATLAVVGAALFAGMVTLADLDTDVRIFSMRLIAAGLFNGSESAETADFWLDTMQATDDALAAAALVVPEVVFSSVLVDLSPHVARLFWAPLVGSSPVPTLTVAGGHPTFGGMPGLPIGIKPVLPGLDDGVVNLNSQSGSNNLISPDIYLYAPPDARIFDMGLPLVRSASFFLEQRRATGLASYGSVPFLSPSGMVQPVLSAPAVPRYPGVFTFLQGTSEHSYSTDAVLGGASEAYVPSPGGGNYEESLVIENATPFTSGLVNPAIVGEVMRYERRLDLTITLVVKVPQISMFPPSFDLVERRITLASVPVWRRFYDLLGSPPAMVSSVSNVDVVATADSVTITGSWPNPDQIEVALTQPEIPGETTYVYRYVLPA